jgi:Aminotransferase class-V
VGEACSKAGTLLLVDSVCTLGGAPLFCDAWGVDCTYSGSQKCLSAPAGAQHEPRQKLFLFGFWFLALLFACLWHAQSLAVLSMVRHVSHSQVLRPSC